MVFLKVSVLFLTTGYQSIQTLRNLAAIHFAHYVEIQGSVKLTAQIVESLLLSVRTVL